MTRLAALPVFLALASCGREPAKLEKSPTPVNLATVELFTPVAGQRYSASIMPNRQAALSFRVGGIVEFIHQVRGADGRPRNLEPGDIVTGGTVLARIRRKDYDLQVGQAGGQLAEARKSEAAARAQVAQAEAGAARAALDYQRAGVLFEKESLTKPDYDAAKAQYEGTRAQVDAARSQLEAVAARIGAAEAALGTATLSRQDTELAAPFTGAIVQRNIETGGLAGPGNPAFTLAELSSVRASFGVPDLVAVHLRPGAAFWMRVEALPERQFRGVVTSVAAVADASTRLFQVELTLSNAPLLLRPGMIATLGLAPGAKAEAVPVVPLSAIVRPPGQSGFAVVVAEGNVARIRPVAVGPSYGDRIAVTSGLEPGERVIGRGATLISDGERLEVIP